LSIGYAYIDDISVTANAAGVPEPSTLALTSAGVLAALYRKRRKI